MRSPTRHIGGETVIFNIQRHSFQHIEGHGKEPKLPASPFSHCDRRVFQVDCPEVRPYTGCRLDFLFFTCVTEINSSIFRFFHGQQHFCLLFFQISCFSSLGASPCMGNTWLPTLVLRLLETMAWQKACQCSSTSGDRHLLFPTFVVSIEVRKAPSSCARKASCSAPSRTTAPGKSVVNFWLYHFLGPRLWVQISNFHCFVIVHSN